MQTKKVLKTTLESTVLRREFRGGAITGIKARKPTNQIRAETKICERKYSFFLRGFLSVMAESQDTPPSDAQLDFDDDNLKGKYEVIS